MLIGAFVPFGNFTIEEISLVWKKQDGELTIWFVALEFMI